MCLKKVSFARQMSDKILVLSVKQQKLKHGCVVQHNRVPLLSTLGCLFFLFYFGSNILQARVPYLCKQTTGKSKDMASPNLSVQSWHANLFKQRRGPWTLPQTQMQISHLRQGLCKNGICTAWCGWLNDAVIPTYQTTKSTQTNRELIYICSQMTDSTRVLLLQPNIHWQTYTPVCVLYWSPHTLTFNCTFPFYIYAPSDLKLKFLSQFKSKGIKHQKVKRSVFNLCLFCTFVITSIAKILHLILRSGVLFTAKNTDFLCFVKIPGIKGNSEQDFASTDHKQLPMQPKKTQP